MTKTVIFAWITALAGTVLWLYGYFASGHPPLVDWRATAPHWIAEFLPNLEAELGIALMLVSMPLNILAPPPSLTSPALDR